MDAGIPTIETPRLRLRPFRAADAAVVTALLEDGEVSRTLASIPYPYRRSYADEWIATHAPVFAARGEIHLAITLRDSDHVLGAIALLVADAGATPELGYWLGRRHWGQGLVTEAARALVDLAQRTLGVRVIRARCMVANPASAAVLIKSGFRRTGRVPPIEKDGCVHDAEGFLLEREPTGDLASGRDRQLRAVPESALIVRVPEAEELVADLRERFDPVARLGVPAHVTILVPFVAPERLDDEVLRRLHMALGSVRPFAFRLADVGCFEDVVYLAPEPAAPFVALTTAVHHAFPEHPPYGGAHASVVPHLTVAHLRGTAQREVETSLRAALPRPHGIGGRCSEVVLIENGTGRWLPRHVVSLT